MYSLKDNKNVKMSLKSWICTDQTRCFEAPFDAVETSFQMLNVDQMNLCLSSSLLPASPELSDTRVYRPDIRALLGTAAHFCEVVVLKLIVLW